ncbi:MAG: hypothetical protein ACXVRS_14935, partial [Gaiellaceae bacterium]
MSHPDPGYLGNAYNRGAYRDFLLALAERSRLWRELPREVATWWRKRDAGERENSGSSARATFRTQS